MVTLSYASCVRALQIRLKLEEEKARMRPGEKSSVQLPGRLKTMREKLEKARNQLIHVSNLRKREAVPKAEVSTDVQRVIDSAIKRVDCVISGLPGRPVLKNKFKSKKSRIEASGRPSASPRPEQSPSVAWSEK
jgi:hypothetical protein